MMPLSGNPIFRVEYLAALLGSIDASVVATDKHFIIQYWNTKAEQLFGCTWQEALGRKGSDLLRFTYRDDTRETALKTLIQNGIWRGSVIFTTAEGKQLLLDVSVTTVRNENGEIIGYVGVHRDVTAADRAKTSLFTFLSFVTSTGDYFFVVDKDLNVAFIDHYTNQRLLDIYGFSYSVGENVLAPLPENRKQQIKACYEKALKGEQNGYEINIETVSGRSLWLRTSYFPVKDDNGFITHGCCLVKDTTAEKQMERVNENLYQSRKLFEIFMENSPILSWITDKNGIVKYLSPSYLKTYRFSKDVIGTLMTKVFPTAASAAFLANIARVYQSGQPLTKIERATTPDGIERTYQVVKFPVATDEDIFIGGWAMDITEETKLRKSLSESLFRLQESENSLKKALAKEHQLNELKSRFVSMASHEFRTPLSTMLSSIYLLERYTTTDQQVNRLKHAGKIKEAIQQLNSLLEDFLTLGKLEEGKTVVTRSSFDLFDLLSEIIEEMEVMKKEGQQIHFRFSGAHTLTTDKKIIRNILLNLLSNAIKFSGEHKPIWLEAVHKGATVWITVKDEGIGISQADQQHLFQTFYRATNAQNIQGTGLGLNIVKQYMDLLQGTIELQSELNKGTRMTIIFPTHVQEQD